MGTSPPSGRAKLWSPARCGLTIAEPGPQVRRRLEADARAPVGQAGRGCVIHTRLSLAKTQAPGQASLRQPEALPRDSLLPEGCWFGKGMATLCHSLMALFVFLPQDNLLCVLKLQRSVQFLTPRICHCNKIRTQPFPKLYKARPGWEPAYASDPISCPLRSIQGPKTPPQGAPSYLLEF